MKAHIIIPGRENFIAPILYFTTTGVVVAHSPIHPTIGEWFSNKFVVGVTS